MLGRDLEWNLYCSEGASICREQLASRVGGDSGGDPGAPFSLGSGFHSEMETQEIVCVRRCMPLSMGRMSFNH